MERETHTPIRRVRIPDHRWNRLGEVAGERGRSALINALIAVYLREPGARKPPPAPKA